jgi:hypothetical protein
MHQICYIGPTLYFAAATPARQRENACSRKTGLSCLRYGNTSECSLNIRPVLGLLAALKIYEKNILYILVANSTPDIRCMASTSIMQHVFQVFIH